MIRLRGISFTYPGELEEVDRTAYIAKKTTLDNGRLVLYTNDP